MVATNFLGAEYIRSLREKARAEKRTRSKTSQDT